MWRKASPFLVTLLLGILVSKTHLGHSQQTPLVQSPSDSDESRELDSEAGDILNEESDVKPVFESDLPGEPLESPKFSSIASFHSGDDIDGEDGNETVDSTSTGNLEELNGTVRDNATELNLSNSTSGNSTRPVKTAVTCLLRSNRPIPEASRSEQINGTESLSDDTDDLNATVAELAEHEAEVNVDIKPPELEIVNVTQLIQDVLWTNSSIKNRSTPANCSIVLFYASWCPFSAKAAPHFNALARAFPDLRVAAIDSSLHSSVNSYFGILSVPTILFFHNGKTMAKFNDTSFTLNKFAEFVHASSELKSDENINVTSQDFLGPLPSTPTKDVDIWLVIAWIFIIICFFHYASKSVLWKKIIELVRTTWREAEDQHEHAD